MLATAFIGLLAVLLAYLSGKGSIKKGYEYAFVILTIFLAVRYDFGKDYMGYLEEFLMYANAQASLFDYNAISAVGKSEIGWVYLMFIFKPLGFYVFVAFLTVIENCILYDFIKRNVLPQWRWLALFIYIFNATFLLTGCAMMRQWLAMCIIIYATRFITEKTKVLPFALCVGLAALFHKSALVVAPIVLLSFVKEFKISYRTGILIGAALVLSFVYANYLLLFINQIFEMELYQGYEHYTDYSVSSAMNLFGVVSTFTMPVACGVMITRFKRNEIVFLVLFIVSIMLMPLRSMSSMTMRMEMYFSVYSIVLFPICISKVRNQLVRYLLTAFVIIVTTISFINVWKAPSSSWMVYFHQYQTIFTHL